MMTAEKLQKSTKYHVFNDFGIPKAFFCFSNGKLLGIIICSFLQIWVGKNIIYDKWLCESQFSVYLLLNFEKDLRDPIHAL